MPSYWDKSVYCSPLAPFISLEELLTPVVNDEIAPALDIPDPALNPAEKLESEQDATAVRAFVEGLRPREQAIVYRVFWLGERQAAVARDLGVSRMAVSKTIKRISQFGRAALADLNDSPLLH